MLLFVYTTTRKRFVIFTCRYFKLSSNTTALSQSNCRNFSCSGIICVTSLGGLYLEGFIFGILQYDNFCIIYYVKLQFTVWGRYGTSSFSHSTIGCGEPDTLQTKSCLTPSSTVTSVGTGSIKGGTEKAGTYELGHMRKKNRKKKIEKAVIGESLFTLFASLTYAYHYLMMLIK